MPQLECAEYNLESTELTIQRPTCCVQSHGHLLVGHNHCVAVVIAGASCGCRCFWCWACTSRCCAFLGAHFMCIEFSLHNKHGKWQRKTLLCASLQYSHLI